MSLREEGSHADELVLTRGESEMEQTMNRIETPTALVDEFLKKHGHTLPGHVIDFALDARKVIADLEEELEREPEPVA